MPGNYFDPLRESLRNRGFRTQALVTLLVFVPVVFGLTRFLQTIEQRQGVLFADPVITLFPAINLTWLIFCVIYVGLISAVVVLVRHPQHLLFALQTYTLLVIVRMVAMFLLPLDPPAGMIELRDPFVEFFGTGQTLSRDLFFSGHTATLFLVALVVPGRPMKIIYMVCTLAVALSVLLQHVHYTIDVFAALFFTYGCYHMIYAIRAIFVRTPGSGYIP